jgi:hypothetical protein
MKLQFIIFQNQKIIQLLELLRIVIKNAYKVGLAK